MKKTDLQLAQESWEEYLNKQRVHAPKKRYPLVFYCAVIMCAIVALLCTAFNVPATTANTIMVIVGVIGGGTFINMRSTYHRAYQSWYDRRVVDFKKSKPWYAKHLFK